ncbi:MAG: 5'/3'-nucleotidase SurE [Alphaproteobacteria bacterium]|nr:5'/3'-nucleotidase SurE [Alphaproteobacteria bacterium]
MNLLITNDDGVDAPGIDALVDALSDLAEVWVVAPEREQSAQSHAFTLHKPLRVSRRSERRIALSGTPADCAYAGIHGLVPRPDFVVSGINRGANLGSDVHYSGTVAGAREAVLQGVPSMAVSLYIRGVNHEDRHWATAGRVAREVLQKALAHGLPADRFLNVNVPNLPYESLRGIRAVPIGRRRYTSMVEVREDPRGNEYVWIGGKPLADEPSSDSDVSMARDGWATVTPMHTNPLSPELIEVVNAWL